MRTVLFSFVLLLFSATYAQCTFPSGNTLNGTAQIFCVGNPTSTITVNNVNSKNYTVINVVKGFTYTFSVADVYSGSNEKLDIYNATSHSNIANASGSAGASITNWVATYSGQIKLVLSRGACNNSDTTNVSVTIQLVNVGNTHDNPNNFGTDTWIGHIYNWMGSPPPGGASPAAPAATLPFDSASYVGYYTIPSESIVEGFGGNYNCLPVYSNGSIRTNIETETYAIRYKMRSTRPAGCYIATIRGDDGIRLYNDGVLVFNSWIQQSATTYSNVLIYLDGSADLNFDFYENFGGNVAEFSLAPFNSSSNAITAPSNATVCSGSSSGIIDGSSFVYNGSAVNPTIAYQWQSSTDNVTFTDIAGATSEDYTPPAITTSTTIVRYYRRQISAVSNSAACKFASNSIAITTTGATATTSPNATAGSGATCSQITANWSAMVGATSYLLDVSTSATFTSFVTGYNGLNVGNVTSYAVTGLVANTTYYYRLRANYTCGLSSNSTVITYATTAAIAPVAIAATSISCSDFTANWNASSDATSYTIDVATTNTFTVGSIIAGYSGLNVGNVTSFTVSGISANTLYYRIRTVGPCGNSSYSNIITVTTPTTTWNGSAWSNGTPTLATTVVINGNYDTASLPSFDACRVTVNSPYLVNVVANKNINIKNDLVVSSGATFTVQSSGSLVQVNDNAVNSGNIVVKRDTNIRLQDYVYWSSPVANFPVSNVSPGTGLNYIYKWNTTVANSNGGQGTWQSANENMVTGKGYIVRGPNSYSNTTPSLFTASFTGVANNGIYTPAIHRGSYTGSHYAGNNGVLISKYGDNWNLVGNPYPSSISALSFLTTNTNIEGAIRIWTHGTLPVSATNPFYSSYTYNYTPNDYITYNGTATTSGPTGFNGYIAAGQSFLIGMNDGPASSSTVVFNNAMRNKTYNNSQFYRASATDNTLSEKHRIWLDLISANGEITRCVVGYVDGATSSKDRIYDAITDYANNQNFYSLIDDEPMIIQGRTLPFAIEDTVPMGIKVPTAGSYTIAVAAVDGLFENGNQKIFLEDKLLHTIHEISALPYSFSATQGVLNDRFVLRYTNETLSTPENTAITGVAIYGTSNGIAMEATSSNIVQYTIYDVLGRTLASKNKINISKVTEQIIPKTNQTLLVSLKLENGQTVVKKIIY